MGSSIDGDDEDGRVAVWVDGVQDSLEDDEMMMCSFEDLDCITVSLPFSLRTSRVRLFNGSIGETSRYTTQYTVLHTEIHERNRIHGESL